MKYVGSCSKTGFYRGKGSEWQRAVCWLPSDSLLIKQLVLMEKQDSQFTDDVTLRRVRETTLAVEKQYVLRILSVCL
jgi:hypothetical protein